MGATFNPQLTAEQQRFLEVNDPPASSDEAVAKPNVLHKYITYNYVLTLSALTAEELNDASYRGKNPEESKILLRSGSGYPDNRVTTAAGKFEFFMEDLRIMSAMGMDKSAKNTNANGISFKIIEPYSMGMFYQALQVSARQQGFDNFSVAPYLLTIEFMGHQSPDKLFEKIPNTTKQISLKLSDISMTVTKEGSVYNIQAYPYNEIAYNTYHSQLPVDVSVRGKKVGQLTSRDYADKDSKDKNLEDVINEYNRKQWKKAGNELWADEIFIRFPNTPKGVANENEIFSTSMNFDSKRTAHPGMIKEDLVYDPSTGIYNPTKIKADPQLSEFKYAQGSDIINVINQIILMSEYPQKALASPDSKGMIKWWRIITEVKIDKESGARPDGTYANYIYYKIIPYKVHKSKFSFPNQKLTGLEQLKREVVKEYNYIYTGKNVDIIDFNIVYDYSFYVNINADFGLRSGETRQQAQRANQVVVVTQTEKRAVSESGNAASVEDPARVIPNQKRNDSNYGGGGGLDNAAAIVARQFFDVVTDMSALMTLDVTILGDPYYLGDSGMGNYFADPTDNKNINSDGAIDYLSSENDIKLTFKNPLDPNAATGLYKFPSSGDAQTKVVEQISGLYQVFTLESIFSRGKFTQILNCTRRQGQVTKNPENTLQQKPQENKPAPQGGVSTDAQ